VFGPVLPLAPARPPGDPAGGRGRSNGTGPWGSV